MAATLAAHYHVFLSFRGPDTRNSFTDCLYRELLRAGIPHVFRDKEEIHGGEDINATLIQAIQRSDISIPIISPDYADSKACLVELAHISLRRQAEGHVVIPIFYHVEPQILRGYPFSLEIQLRQRPRLPGNVGDRERIIRRWTDALFDFAREPRKYYHVPDRQRPWTEVFSEVVGDVNAHLRRADLMLPPKLVGIDHHVKEIMRKLGVVCRYGEAVELLGGEEVRVVAITGLSGTGKTTLAREVYNKIHLLFESSSCLHQIHKNLQSPNHRPGRLKHFQKKLISELNRRPYRYKGYDRAIIDLQSLFQRTRALIVLDDIHDETDIEGLAANCGWFGPGSRIIVTSDIKHLKADLVETAQEHVVEEMDKNFAFDLFCEYAFRKLPEASNEYVSLAEQIVPFAEGIPSAIVAQGKNLRGESTGIWKDRLSTLKKSPNTLFTTSLEASYRDLLENPQNLCQNCGNDCIQHIFLDIACFFNGTDKNVSQYMWNACDFHTTTVFKSLCNLFWMKINENEELWIRDQLQRFGKEKATGEHTDSRMRSRLWDPAEAALMLNQNGDGAVATLGLNCKGHDVSLTYASFAGLPNLVFLNLDKVVIKENFERTRSWWCPTWHLKSDTSPKPCLKLIQLQWQGCSKCESLRFVDLERLVILDLSESEVNHQWNGWKDIKQAKELKVLKLTSSKVLAEFPDLGENMNLERLILDRCSKLQRIDSINKLKKLKYLNLKYCTRVWRLPELEELLVDDTVITRLYPDQHGAPVSLQDSLTKLKILSARCKTLNSLTNSIGHLRSLTKLELDGATEIEKLPNSITSLTKLKVLSLKGCRNIRCLPEHIGNMTSLEKLELSGTFIAGLPPSVSNLENLKVLKMRQTFLEKFPDEVLRLAKLEVMDLRCCRRLKGKIPPNIRNLSSLRALGLSYTQISDLSDSITELFHLQFLELCECRELRRDSIPRDRNWEVRDCLTATGEYHDHGEFERYEQLDNACSCIA